MNGEFDWTVGLRSWRPQGRPHLPYGPTMVDSVRSCMLQVFFAVSTGYERRMDFAGRIGTAFHKGVESLSRDPLRSTNGTDAAFEARARFDQLIDHQRQLASTLQREQRLPQDEHRIQRAREAIMAEATRRPLSPKRRRPSSPTLSAETEVEVRSSDGMFRGFVDRAEHRSDGTHIIDYKSALRPDVPGRYKRQIQMYAAMWADTRGDWPVMGSLRYPAIAQSFDVPIDRGSCLATMSEARHTMEQLQTTDDVSAAATPGDPCRVCEFRPWCQPFWMYQREVAARTASLGQVGLGFEGPITSLQRTDSLVSLSVRWLRAELRVVVKPERFPQLMSVEVGDVVRGLDFDVRGVLTAPRALATDYSELYAVVDENPDTGRPH